MSHEFGYVDMAGGEMPSVKYSYRLFELDTVCRVLDSVFAQLEKSTTKMPAFGVPFNVKELSNIETASIYIKYILMDRYNNLKLYESNGNVIFDIRGASGGVVTNQVFYLLKR